MSRDNYAEAGNWAGWSYPVCYGKENEVAVDVLVLGGGIAGWCVAINVAKRGLSVALIEKGARSEAMVKGRGVTIGCIFLTSAPRLPLRNELLH